MEGRQTSQHLREQSPVRGSLREASLALMAGCLRGRVAVFINNCSEQKDWWERYREIQKKRGWKPEPSCGFDIFIVILNKQKGKVFKRKMQVTSQKLTHDWTWGCSMVLRHRFCMCAALGLMPSTKRTQQNNRKAHRTPKSFTLETDGSE